MALWRRRRQLSPLRHFSPIFCQRARREKKRTDGRREERKGEREGGSALYLSFDGTLKTLGVVDTSRAFYVTSTMML